MRSFLLPVFLLLLAGLTAQDCYYQLQLTDTGGDGWNGGSVTVNTGGVSRSYTLNATADDGASRNFFFPVTDGATVILAYRAGAFPDEVGFTVLDKDDSVIYTIDAPVTDAALTSFTAACKACAPPPLSSIDLYRVRYNSVDIRFRGTAGSPTYAILYGPQGTDPDSEDITRITTQDTMLRVGDLSPLTTYDFYVETECGDSDSTSVRRGPFRIRTQRQKDVGVTVLRQPTDGCQHEGTDSVTVGITNFGGEPQQFIRLDFTVNGEESGVSFPFDGIYTGVVGVDSTEYFTFDTGIDLSEAGYYEIKVFTMLEDDEVPANDTLTASVVSLPKIAEFPYVETFEGGDGFWLPQQGGRGPVSWGRGRPTGQRIDQAGAGAFSYVTNPGGLYNDDELSYLSSPCFNFSGLTEDPLLSFLLYVDTEANFDGLSVQATTDGGNTWRLLQRNTSSINWYNNGIQQQWDGDGGFGGGYALVSHRLSGLAGEEEVRLRFVFESDGDGQREGVSIDNVRITEAEPIDYAVVRARLFNQENCDERTDTLAVTFLKLGTQSVDSVSVSYTLNGGPTVTGRAAAPQTVGQPLTFRFPEPLTVTTGPDTENRLLIRVSADGDSATYNDTLTFVYPQLQDIPFIETFDDGRRPDGWGIPADVVIARREGTPSLALTDNLNGEDGEMTFTTASYAGLQSGDEFFFTLRVRDAGGNPVTSGVDQVLVSLTGTCDESATVLLELQNPPADTTVVIPLTVSGSGYTFGFDVTGGSSDVFVTLDDIGVRRCPGNLDLRYTTAPPSGIFADDGTAYVLAGAGLAPYTYAWSNGDTTQSADSLSVADYSVTVTDAVGCTDELSVSVDLNAVSTQDPNGILEGVQVFPNPTAGRLAVRLELPSVEEVSLELFDATGRRLQLRKLGRQVQAAEEVDLSDAPSGLYLLRIRAGDALRTMIVTKR